MLQIYLANLHWWTTDLEVESLCTQYGQVSFFLSGGCCALKCVTWAHGDYNPFLQLWRSWYSSLSTPGLFQAWTNCLLIQVHDPANELCHDVAQNNGAAIIHSPTIVLDVHTLQVANVEFMTERSNGKSKGVALVEFTTPEAAVACKEALQG